MTCTTHESTMESYYKICDNVYDEHLTDVNLVTIDIVKEAISKLKDNKSDAVYNYSTDCFKNGGDSVANSVTYHTRCPNACNSCSNCQGQNGGYQ